ncbi:MULTISPECIES: acyclic terpene utilization AtuA family protein [unclassified Streptomyces]|uniref:acyclic terpene utilization AtuA family protein n=1 Tax=unclassified Streptomyces TaxID=2593676 RepID=UPI00278C84B4|nr:MULTISPECIES: acyclic terpene utilization AtuA family protein [unclassified Streptomyces]
MSGPVLRIGNASGFYGDRFDAMKEMLTGGELDVLTGDYLAELTMLILGRDRLKSADRGYARTFLRQLEECLGLAVERGVKVVTNAGGLNPAGLADAVRELAARLGVPVRVAHVEGDDLLATGRFPGALTANAYLGGAGIAACLGAGADIVVTGRVTDAALVTGPAAWHFGWAGDAYDRLAGAVVAGHVLECGTQATGGNYSRFASRAGELGRPGFPIAEMHEDGSAVITKHPGTGGFVEVGTVTEQLLYETGGARYAGPDVTARLDTVRLEPDGPDRVRVHGVRGEAPPPTLKVGLNRLGGYRNEVVFVLTGLDIEAKADLVRHQMEDHFRRAKSGPEQVRWELARTDHPDADTEETASALLRLVVRDQDQDAVGRALSGAAVELALASYPGFHVTEPPGKGSPYGVFEAAYVERADVQHVAVLPDGERRPIPVGEGPTRPLDPVDDPELPPPPPPGPTRRVPLGLIAGARSGDKGGDANVGVWVETAAAWQWLVHELTVERFRELLPESSALGAPAAIERRGPGQRPATATPLPVTRHPLPNLRALNFTVERILGEGVAARHRFDPQAKGLGEWLRSRHLDIPEALL